MFYPQYFALLLIIIFVTAGWLWQQGRQRDRMAVALLGLTVLTTAGLVLSFAVPEPDSRLALGWGLLAWGILLWGVRLRWVYGLALLIATALFYILSLLPALDLLAWGLVTAVPLTAVISVQRKKVSIPPIIAAELASGYLHPVSMEGHLSADMLNTERPILECLTDGLLVCGQSGLIMTVNQAATVILGLPEDKMIGRPVTEILVHFPQVDTEEPVSNARTFAMNGRTIQGQMNIIYNAEGSVQGTVFVLRDITVEFQARQAADSFLTTVSHELRTPLTAIKGYTELLELSLGQETGQKQLLFVNTIQRNVARMVQLVNSLIFASSVKGGRLEYQPGYADLPQLIRQIVREMQPRAAKVNQRLEMEVDGRLGQIEADPMHVATILEELITNGLKYGRDGGVVRVIANRESDEFAVVSISDNGIGIAEEDQSRIFEQFFRPETRDEQIQTGGIGMGLSIVRALVEAYNGRIWFESIPNKGTTFTFILPTRQPQKPAPLVPAAAPYQN
ncbi:MAG TPA: PAS domain S-box protein [Chloroflexi bacterium]|nr:PAS domain S-box protein [Chloroflexota bacterium]